jgi:predicted secreted hydrolase
MIAGQTRSARYRVFAQYRVNEVYGFARWLLYASIVLCSLVAHAGAPIAADRSARQEPSNVPGGSRADAARGQGGATQGFAVAAGPRSFEFPRDHGPHPDFQHEWWYVTGNLDGANGERFGFELTIFRFALAPAEPTAAGHPPRNGAPRATDPATQPAAPAPGTSNWRTRQIYMAHFAVSDIHRERFQFGERYARGALGLAGAQAEPFRVWLESWALEQRGSHWHLTAADRDYSLDLDLQPLLPPILNGDAGLSRKSSSGTASSYYYSIPRIAARGTLTRQGKPIDVQGLAWLDREWGSADGDWDWFAIQLDDRSTLMFYVLRNRDGVRDINSAGTWVDPHGSPRPLANDEVRIDILGYWNSPRGGRYPAKWRLSVPALALDLSIEPAMADQELGTHPRYWEGAVNVQGQREGRSITGRGYVELVGYARPRAR